MHARHLCVQRGVTIVRCIELRHGIMTLFVYVVLIVRIIQVDFAKFNM